MSTWGIGAFDNDDAAQWAAKFDASSSVERVNVVRNALRVVLDRDHTAEEFAAVAAATTVASSLPGGPLLAPDYGPDRHLIEQFRASDDLPDLAVRALNRIKGAKSEWSGLWNRAGSLDDAVAVIDAIIDELELRTVLPEYVALSA
ncbi:DUF4259 domain-containing protein [Williamsia sp. 1135]|uniref:DUF4259 domain-containing protein n=1 Tax=Williamsia sp. 1135 TaxID=1889262 RepID=UPI00143CA4C3|nr:DUF4259 domain-containing protein [Williamsia sp. 1135]